MRPGLPVRQEQPVNVDKLVTLVRQAHKAILVRQVQQARAGLVDLQAVQERLVTLGQADRRDPRVEQVRRVTQVLTEQLEARARRARRDLLASVDPLEIPARPAAKGPREPQVIPARLARQV